MRPFECQTASRRILDVSVPYALLSCQVDGRTGRWFVHPFISSLHVLLVYQIRTIPISRPPSRGPRRPLFITSVGRCTKKLCLQASDKHDRETNCTWSKVWKTHEEREERKRECVAAVIIESFRYWTLAFDHSASNNLESAPLLTLRNQGDDHPGITSRASVSAFHPTVQFARTYRYK